MMKAYRFFVLTVLAAVGLSSCNDRLLPGTEKGSGQLSISVNKDTPAGKAVMEVLDFPVIIKSAGQTVRMFDRVSEVPSSMRMDVGDYTVESHTPGSLSRKMYEPYYSGSSDIKIIAGTTTMAEVVCLMQNTRITIKYGTDFYSVFKSWTITLDDGSNTALTFTQADARTDDKTVIYWWFTDKVTDLNINFTGVTAEGSKISQKYTLSKSAIETHYDDDKEYFAGGDALEFSFTPEESTAGKIEKVNLTASIVFEETEETVIVNVQDEGTYEGGDDDPQGGDDDPEYPELIPIKLTIPSTITVTESTDPASGDVKIEAENGLQSLAVTITSSSDDLIDALNQLTAVYPAVDLVKGCEVVGNTSLVDMLGSLGQVITVPAVGDKEYVFPVGNFFLFLSALPGEHHFQLTATDVDGNEKTGTLIIIIPEV